MALRRPIGDGGPKSMSKMPHDDACRRGTALQMLGLCDPSFPIQLNSRYVGILLGPAAKYLIRVFRALPGRASRPHSPSHQSRHFPVSRVVFFLFSLS